MVPRSSRRSFVAAAVLAAFLFVGCGGSGGGGGSDPVPPGTLAALAVEGASTPAGGTYATFGPATLLAAADGGWVAFVADVVGGTTSRGLFVARPGGQVVLVYGKGEPVPSTNGAAGTIDDFERIWMRPDGIVVALVEIAAGSTAGILTAEVDSGGTVGTKRTAVHYGVDLPKGASTADPGTLTAIDDELVEVSDLGNVYFAGTGSGGSPLHGIWAARADGSELRAVAVTNDPVNDAGSQTFGTLGTSFSGLGIDADGLLVAFACDVSGGPAEALFATRGNGFAVIARDGLAPPSAGGRTFADTYDGGPIVVGYNGSDIGVVTWRGSLSGADPSHGIFTRTIQVPLSGILVLGALNDVILPSELVANTGGGFAYDVRILPGQDDPTRWPIEVLVSGGTTDRVYLSAPNKDTLTEIFRQGSLAPDTDNTFANNYPSLTFEEQDAQSRDGSFAFTAVLVDGTTGLWWPMFGSDFFLIARQGATAPGTGGGTFGSFATPSVVSVGADVLAFRATVVAGTGGTGIFRQG